MSVAEALTVTSAPQIPVSLFTLSSPLWVITGTSLSVTITNWSQVSVLPEASSAVQVTIVVPIGNIAGALLVRDVTRQSSFAVAVPMSTFDALHNPLSVETFFVGGQLIIGGVSVIVIVCSTVTELQPVNPSIRSSIVRTTS